MNDAAAAIQNLPMGVAKEPAAGLYGAAHHAGTSQQADALKRGNFALPDRPNFIEEIESLGRSEERGLESRLRSGWPTGRRRSAA